MAATRTSSVWLVCVYALVALSAMAAPAAQANQFTDGVRDVFQGAVDAVKNVTEKINAGAENTFNFDWNKDGQIGEFRAVPDNEADPREVTRDNNAADRFKHTRPRTGRMLKGAGDRHAAVAPAAPPVENGNAKARPSFGTAQVQTDPNGADRFKHSRPPRTG